jgi:hypothetical protein
VQPVHRGPIEPFPGSVAVMQAKVEQDQDRLVDPIGVDLHDVIAFAGRHLTPAGAFITAPKRQPMLPWCSPDAYAVP